MGKATCILGTVRRTMPHPLPEWARQIKKFRRSQNMTQQELAKKVGITKKIVADWEQGRQEPSLKRYIQLLHLAEPEQARWFLGHIGLAPQFLRTLLKEASQRE